MWRIKIYKRKVLDPCCHTRFSFVSLIFMFSITLFLGCLYRLCIVCHAFAKKKYIEILTVTNTSVETPLIMSIICWEMWPSWFSWISSAYSNRGARRSGHSFNDSASWGWGSWINVDKECGFNRWQHFKNPSHITFCFQTCFRISLCRRFTTNSDSFGYIVKLWITVLMRRVGVGVRSVICWRHAAKTSCV